MCLYPRLIKNRKYVKNKKNGGNVPTPTDRRALYVPVGCGKCMECKAQKARQWQVRLHEEIRENKNGQFVTLSFSNEALEELEGSISGLTGYNLDNEVATLATRRFLERWRKKYKKSCRHWFVTELGQVNTERIHIHGLMFTNESKDTIAKIWKYGNVYIGDYVNEKTINYIVKYINKVDEKHKEFNAKVLTSPGIGAGYTKRKDAENNRYEAGKTNESYRTRNGIKLNLPIYYRNKIYTEDEREALWMEKLDKEERWVNGVKVDVSEGDEEYYQMLYEARKKNKRLGFGDNEIDWEKRRYENNKRDMLRRERGKNLGKRNK